MLFGETILYGLPQSGRARAWETMIGSASPTAGRGLMLSHPLRPFFTSRQLKGTQSIQGGPSCFLILETSPNLTPRGRSDPQSTPGRRAQGGCALSQQPGSLVEIWHYLQGQRSRLLQDLLLPEWPPGFFMKLISSQNIYTWLHSVSVGQTLTRHMN